MRKASMNGCVSAAAMLLAAGGSMGAPPAYTAAVIARSGDTVLSTASTIARSQEFPPFGSLGIQGVGVNNSGMWDLRIETRHNVNIGNTMHKAVVRTQNPQGPFTPYVLQGTVGYLSVPTATGVATDLYNHAMNGAGSAVYAIQWAPDDFGGPAGTGVIYNSNRVVFLEGDAVNAAGVDAGATWEAVGVQTALALNESNQVMVASTINELGASRRAIVRFQLDGSGNVTGRTLIAKEGGPAGSGGATWTSIAPGPAQAAMNAGGAVVFSGTTSAGADGVYSTAGTGGFVGVAGGASPTPGVNWGSLAGSVVDINAAGTVAFIGKTANTLSTYAESTPDAGDVFDSEDHTYGNGPLTLITGTLSDDHDVDFFRITVTDGDGFSATTVPDAGSGFVGASFDTVLTLVADPGENIGAQAGGRTQCDNAASGVLQSTITGGSGRAITGDSYYLAISTPKSRIAKRVWHFATNTYPVIEGWQMDPGALAAGGGLVYWPDVSAGVVRRVTTAGVTQSDIARPGVYAEIALDTVNGRMYWVEGSIIKRSNLDGSVVEDVIGGAGSTVFTAGSCTGLAVDGVRGRVYWSRSVHGELYSADLDGQNATRVIRDSIAGGDVFPGIDPTGTFAPGKLAIDTSAGLTGKIYWVNAQQNSIERCNIDPIGTGRSTVVSNAGVAWSSGIAIDSAAGKLYWASTAAGKVRRANLDGSAAEDVAVSPMPLALALDGAGSVHWTNTLDRVIRKATITGGLPATPQTVTTVVADIGERGPDGPGRSFSGYLSSFTRVGTATPGALGYQIKLTGATFQYERKILAKGTQKVVGVGDSVPGVASSVVSVIGQGGTPVRIDDRGNVMWYGGFYPVTADNHPNSGVFHNQDVLLSENVIPPGSTLSQRFLFLQGGAHAFDLSPNGEHAVLSVNMSAPPYLFSQFDNALKLSLTLPASCPADFNGNGSLTVQDIFDFLNAWFAGTPSADFNGAGGISVQDIFDFLNAWFAGCA